MREADVVIGGGGLAGSTAAAMLGRAGFQVALIDPHTTYPPDFRCEKLDGSQVRLFRATGLADPVLRAAVTLNSTAPAQTIAPARRRHLCRPPAPPASVVVPPHLTTTSSLPSLRYPIPLHSSCTDNISYRHPPPVHTHSGFGTLLAPTASTHRCCASSLTFIVPQRRYRAPLHTDRRPSA